MTISPDHKCAKPADLSGYLAVMSRAVYQAGLSWAAIDRQWKNLCNAFENFDPHRVSKYGAKDIVRIMSHPGILHSERKVEATVANARTMLELERKCGKFEKYLRSFSAYDELVADLKRRFSHVGDVSAYYFLFRVAEPVPPFAHWSKTVKGTHPRIKEMVGAG